MRWCKRVLAIVGMFLLVFVLGGLLLWWTAPKRPVAGFFVREAGASVFKFTDIPRGRPLSREEVDTYARKLLAEMSLEEKVLQMSGDTSTWDLVRLWLIDRGKYNDAAIAAGEDSRLAIPPIRLSDGPRGVVMKHSTAFPAAIARAASWDRVLQRKFGDAVAKEIRAQEGNLWSGVCVNLLRHPSWGRAQETLGEDPYLVGELSVASVRAVQAHHVMACAKHFALNSIETTRTTVDVHVDERTLREVYLPHFKRLADENIASFMTAYNRVQGDYCSENRHLLRDILKEEWGYRGFVMSDFFDGVHDGVKAATAGLDLEMPWTRAYGKKLIAAVQEGRVALDAIDEAVLRLLRRKIEYAASPDRIPYPAELVRAPEHAWVAREIAEKGTVLLKNADGLLPLDAKKVKSILLVGRLADAPNLGDWGSSRVYPPDTVTIARGLREALGPTRVLYEPRADPERVKALAKAADAVVVVVGFDQGDEGEYVPDRPKGHELGGDRLDLALKRADRDLVLQMAAETPRTIVLLIGGSAITVEEWQDKVGAILMAFYPGEQAGTALANLLLGKVTPSGKLPFTVPKDMAQLPPFDNRSNAVEYGYYHGYTLAEKRGWEPRYPFGYGLSYTRFAYSALSLDRAEVREDGVVTVSVTVTNAGSYPGKEVVQLYVGFTGSKVERPVKLLRGFERVLLAPRETKKVRMALKARDLAYYDSAARTWVVERMEYPVFVGGSSRTSDLLTTSFRVID